MIRSPKQSGSVSGVRHLIGLLILGFLLSGCYTRQIEGIQKDLDHLDRKLHKVNVSNGEPTGKSIPPEDITRLKRELEQVRSQQVNLSSDLQVLREGVEEVKQEPPASFPEPLPAPKNAPKGKDVEHLHKQISANQEQIQKFERELSDLKTTFEDVRSSMLDVIAVLKEEYEIEQSVSSPPESTGATTQVEGPGPVSSAAPSSQEKNTYVVKAGDSLNGIASRFGVSAKAIQEANQITNPNKLILGQELYIP